MQSFSLRGKTILITGASSGIGKQTAITASEAGAHLILTGRDENRLKETLEAISTKGEIIIGDLTDESDRLKIADACTSLDGIVHGAGVVKPFPTKYIGQKNLDEIYQINYEAPVFLMSALFQKKKINKEASIVFLSSVSSNFPHKAGALYSGAKSALNAYSKVLALEYAPQKIRSNAILAAMVKTPMFYEAEAAVSKEKMDEHGSHYPLGFGEPIDVARCAVFLLSPASKWITGTEIVMDGGLTAGT